MKNDGSWIKTNALIYLESAASSLERTSRDLLEIRDAIETKKTTIADGMQQAGGALNNVLNNVRLDCLVRYAALDEMEKVER